MAKVKTNLSKMNVEGRLDFVQQVITKMTGNATYATPNPALTAITTLRTALQTKSNDYNGAKQTADQLLTERNTANDALVAAVTSLAAYVENTSGGDVAKIQSAGFDVRADASPVGSLDQVGNLSATAGDNDGTVDLGWDPVRGAKSYEIQTSPDATAWTTRQTVTASSVTLTGLPSAARCWFRVRGIGAAGAGAWSDPATKTVP